MVTTEVPCSLPARLPPPAYDPVTTSPTPSAGTTATRGRPGGPCSPGRGEGSAGPARLGGRVAKTVAEHLVDLMVAAGVERVYGVVGDSANPVVDALRRREDRIRFVPVRNEEAGAFAAGADALVSGHPAAVVGSAGPGSLHLLNGLYDCHRNAAPVFAIATHIPSTEVGTEYFQETRPDQVFADCTRFCATITTPGQMPRIAELAMQAAILERGVGMVILPGDLGAQEVHDPLVSHPVATARPVVRPSEADLDRLADLVARARKVAIFAGEGCRSARTEVLDLARTLAAPVAYAYRGKDVVEADNPHAVGMTGLLGWGGATHALQHCDLLLMLGTDFPYHDFLPAGATIVQVDDDPSHLGRRARVGLGLVGDVGETLRALRSRLHPVTDRSFLDEVLGEHRRSVERLGVYVHHPGHGTGLRPEMVTAAISDLADDDAVFCADTGMCNVWSARYLTMTPGRRLLASFGHGSMANAMPQAIGAALAEPGRQVVALCGDGGFSMLLGELLTIAGSGIPVKLMVYDNSTLGMVRAEMQVAGYPPYGTDVRNPDFGALARAVGIPGVRVEDPGDIRPAVQEALAHDGPALVDLVTDPRALSIPPHTTFEQVRGYALASAKAVFTGDGAEVWESAKANLGNLGQVL